MKLTIAIDMDNDAFVPEPGCEAAAVLKLLAKQLPPELSPGDMFTVHDSNGNSVCTAMVTAYWCPVHDTDHNEWPCPACVARNICPVCGLMGYRYGEDGGCICRDKVSP